MCIVVTRKRFFIFCRKKGQSTASYLWLTLNSFWKSSMGVLSSNASSELRFWLIWNDLKLTTRLAEKLNWLDQLWTANEFHEQNLPAAAGRGTGEVFGRSYDGIVSWISAGVAGNPWLMTAYCTGRVMVGGGGQVLGRQRLWWPNLWLLLMIYWQVTLLSAGKFSPLLFLCPLSQSIQGEVVQVQIVNLPVVKIVWNALILQPLQRYITLKFTLPGLG